MKRKMTKREMRLFWFILVLVIYGFGLCWVCIVFEEIYGMRRKMTKREMGNYFGFGLGLCSYVLFWFVLGL